MKKLMILGSFLAAFFAASQAYAVTATKVPAVGQTGAHLSGMTAPQGLKKAVKTAKTGGYKETLKAAK